MTGDNPMGAENQQERPGFEQWVVGFVDGEGCFSVALYPNRKSSLGWQVLPDFVVVQGERSLSVLHDLKRFFGCGAIYVNRRYDNHRENLYRYNVRRQIDLRNCIVPFFEENPLRTAKREEFLRFRKVLRMMELRLHLSLDGLRRIAEITQTMNHRKPSRFLESSEAIRQPASFDRGAEEMVRATWRHVEVSSEIPCRVSSDLHEWRNDLGTVSTGDSAKLHYE